MSEAPTALVFSPHPDDEVIGCGGSCVKLVEAGWRLVVVIVIRRERSFHNDDVSDAAFAEESREASRILGASKLIELEMPSRDVLDSRAVHVALVSHVRRLRPRRVYLPADTEADPEHVAVGRLARQAVWMAQQPFFPEAGERVAPAPELVLGYEVWTPIPSYQYVEDISGVLDRKLRALRAYRSQIQNRPYDQAIAGLNAYRGVMALGGGHAEVFTVLSLTAGQEDGGG